jgi:hypothetical protein
MSGLERARVNLGAAYLVLEDTGNITLTVRPPSTRWTITDIARLKEVLDLLVEMREMDHAPEPCERLER